MNGARTTFMRRGYLLTALAAAVLLAASSGTASAQSVGFVGSGGMVAEAASFEAGAFEGPHVITIRGTDIPQSRRDTMLALSLAVTGTGRYAVIDPATGRPAATPATIASPIVLTSANFNNDDEAVLLVVQGATDGATDNNWLDERIIFTMSGNPATPINPNVYVVTVDDSHTAPVAQFSAPSFTLTEGSDRDVSLNIVSGTTGRADATIPGAVQATGTANDGNVVLSVSNHDMVTIGAAATAGPGGADCPAPVSQGGNRRAVHIALGAAWGTPDQDAFDRTARLATDATATGGSVATLADVANTADMTFKACAVSGFRNQSIMLTILGSPSTGGLVEATAKPAADKRGDVAIGSPLTVTVDSDEAAPTLSFSPTDVTIDEGGSTSTRLIADGTNATEVGMVKLMVEGDAMVDLYHEDTMLEEMNGYVMVDMGMNNSARLTAMSTSDPDLMDGEMAYKAWKLMEGSSDAAIGDDYWFRVDVRGSTAVPALPLVGQLLLALFLMAGGSRLYRRRNG